MESGGGVSLFFGRERDVPTNATLEQTGRAERLHTWNHPVQGILLMAVMCEVVFTRFGGD